MPDHPSSNRPGRLALQDGSVFSGQAFGAVGRNLAVSAEVVFNTAMCGYQEALTDPSYTGQILVMTYPLMGNYGVNPQDVESSKVQVSGFIVRELARVHSNYRANADLASYLDRSNVLGLAGLDTRALTRILRSSGVQQGLITDRTDLTDEQLVQMARNAPSMNGQNLVPIVGCSSRQTWAETLGEWSLDVVMPPVANVMRPNVGGRTFRVLALDCGAKSNILRNLADRGCQVHVVPHDIDPKAVLEMYTSGQIDGLFISNGPGDPAAVNATINTLRQVVGPQCATPIPTFGICLGHQLLALALGAKTFKLKFGHRGANQPVLNLLTNRVEITSQNHGFAVDPDSLKSVGGEPTHIHLNDRTLAGFRLTQRPLFCVQYHPEASPGPHDSAYLFDAFVQMMADKKPTTFAIQNQSSKVGALATV